MTELESATNFSTRLSTAGPVYLYRLSQGESPQQWQGAKVLSRLQLATIFNVSITNLRIHAVHHGSLNMANFLCYAVVI